MKRNYLELIQQFIRTDFILRYKNSYLGILWIMIKPLASFGVIFIVWSHLFAMDSDYKMGLLFGIIFMNLFNEAIMMGLTSLMSKASIILKINFPKEVVVYSAISIALIDFLLNMVVFIVFSFFTPVHPTFLGFLLMFLCILCMLILTLGLSLFLSVIFIRLRDLHNFMEVALQLLIWLTPVYYRLEAMPQYLQSIIKLNPLTFIVTYARKGLINGADVRPEDFMQIFILLGITTLLLLIGRWFFKKQVSKIAEYF